MPYTLVCNGNWSVLSAGQAGFLGPLSLGGMACPSLVKKYQQCCEPMRGSPMTWHLGHFPVSPEESTQCYSRPLRITLTPVRNCRANLLVPHHKHHPRSSRPASPLGDQDAELSRHNGCGHPGPSQGIHASSSGSLLCCHPSSL